MKNFKQAVGQHKRGIIIVSAILVLWSAGGAFAWYRFDSGRQAKATVAAEELERLNEGIAKYKAEQAELQRQAAAAEEKSDEEQAEATASPTTPPAPTSPQAETGCNVATTHKNPAAIDVVVNKKHCLTPLTFVPPDLVASHGATLSSKAVASFNAMFAAAAAAGQPFTVSSSYRSYDTQVATYNHWVSVNGQQGADTVSARPGYSEHQTGFVIDVGANGCNLDCFGGTSQYQWFQANAAKYGFIQRYYAGYEHITGYASEEWHYRYVGVDVAQDMAAKGIKTLEQYWGIEGGGYR